MLFLDLRCSLRNAFATKHYVTKFTNEWWIERASEYAIHSDDPFITPCLFTGSKRKNKTDFQFKKKRKKNFAVCENWTHDLKLPPAVLFPHLATVLSRTSSSKKKGKKILLCVRIELMPLSSLLQYRPSFSHCAMYVCMYQLYLKRVMLNSKNW